MNDSKNFISNPTYNNKLKREFYSLDYNPLKTIKECNRWLSDTYKIPHVNFTGFDIRTANAVNRQLQLLFNKYPEINSIRWIDDIDYSAELYLKNSLIGKSWFQNSGLDIDTYLFSHFSNCHAIVIREDCEYKGIWFNTIDLESYDIIYSIIKKNIEVNHLSKSTCGIERIVTHEFGHHILEFLRKNKLDSFVLKIWRKYQCNIRNKKKQKKYIKKNEKILTKKLSRYAYDNIDDFYAEALCEYIHNPSPRKIAKTIGVFTHEAFQIYRTQKKDS